MQDRQIARGDILTFAVKSSATSGLYCYLIDITPNGKITPPSLPMIAADLDRKFYLRRKLGLSVSVVWSRDVAGGLIGLPGGAR